MCSLFIENGSERHQSGGHAAAGDHAPRLATMPPDGHCLVTSRRAAYATTKMRPKTACRRFGRHKDHSPWQDKTYSTDGGSSSWDTNILYALGEPAATFVPGWSYETFHMSDNMSFDPGPISWWRISGSAASRAPIGRFARDSPKAVRIPMV